MLYGKRRDGMNILAQVLLPFEGRLLWYEVDVPQLFAINLRSHDSAPTSCVTLLHKTLGLDLNCPIYGDGEHIEYGEVVFWTLWEKEEPDRGRE